MCRKMRALMLLSGDGMGKIREMIRREELGVANMPGAEGLG